jgi:hypothetical protein
MAQGAHAFLFHLIQSIFETHLRNVKERNASVIISIQSGNKWKKEHLCVFRQESNLLLSNQFPNIKIETSKVFIPSIIKPNAAQIFLKKETCNCQKPSVAAVNVNMIRRVILQSSHCQAKV